VTATAHDSTARPGGLLDGLNAAQREAAEAVRGPVCILAGAGTGKTRTITHRIAHQVASGAARPEEVMAVTFTERAASELKARLAALGLPAHVRAATFHSAAWAQVRHFWSRISDEPLPDVLPSKLRLLIPLARKLRVEAADLAAEIEWAKARRLGPGDYAAGAAAARRDAPLPAARMAEVFARYERDKRAAGLIDYDDMLLLATDAITGHAEVAAEVRARYRSFTVDEFQDVNAAQWALLGAWLGDGQDLCVVGDDDQTIYRFTGATSSYLTGFRERFPAARVVTLTENYRSTPEVLALANRVLWTKPRALRKQLRSSSGPGQAPRFQEFADAEAEVEAVVEVVRELRAGGVPAGGIAVAYRINSQSEPFEEAFRRAGVPHTVRGDAGFFDRPEVSQAVAALRAAARQPPERRGGPPLPGTTPATTARLDREVERVLRERLSFSARREPDGEAARSRWRNLVALQALAARLAGEDPATDLAAFVEEIDRRAAAGHDSPEDGGAVTLTTIHKAKGLEFDAVLLVSLEEGLLPISHARTDEEIEDERRLLYVGVTRARRHLWLSWARSRTGRRGKPVRRRPSRLLYNLGPGAPTSGEAAAARAPAGQAGHDGGADPELVEKLRAWRRRRSELDRVPAFVVFNDRTLHDLARLRPGSPEGLLAVHGLGPAKVDRYGQDLLDILCPPGAS
jgi:DNA helicase-2/ATP-dependent DNA helicase PcrA